MDGFRDGCWAIAVIQNENDLENRKKNMQQIKKTYEKLKVC